MRCPCGVGLSFWLLHHFCVVKSWADVKHLMCYLGSRRQLPGKRQLACLPFENCVSGAGAFCESGSWKLVASELVGLCHSFASQSLEFGGSHLWRNVFAVGQFGTCLWQRFNLQDPCKLRPRQAELCRTNGRIGLGISLGVTFPIAFLRLAVVKPLLFAQKEFIWTGDVTR